MLDIPAIYTNVSGGPCLDLVIFRGPNCTVEGCMKADTLTLYYLLGPDFIMSNDILIFHLIYS